MSFSNLLLTAAFVTKFNFCASPNKFIKFQNITNLPLLNEKRIS